MKIGILLPPVADVGWLARAAALARMIVRGSGNGSDGGNDISIAIGLPEADEARWRKIERHFRQIPSVVVRHVAWEGVEVEHARRMFYNLDKSVNTDGLSQVMVPRDWGWNFTDCDVWLNCADPGLGAVLPLKPVFHYCRDLAVRVVPHAYARNAKSVYWKRQIEAFHMWRQARVGATDDETRDNLIGYAGIRRDDIVALPNIVANMHLSDEPARVRLRDSKRIIWWVEPSVLFDLEQAAEGLALYIGENGKLRPLILSEDPDAFAKGSAHPAITRLPQRLRTLLADLPKERIGTEQMMTRLISSADIVWSSRVAGGEGEACWRAVVGGAMFVGVEQPAVHAALGALAAPAILYPMSDRLRIADALHAAERAEQVCARRGDLPLPQDGGDARLCSILRGLADSARV